MAALATDDFNRADGGLGANWATISGNGAPTIRTNAVETVAVSTDSAARYTAVVSPADQYAQVKPTVLNTNSGRGIGVALRAASAANTYYRLVARGPLGAGAGIEIHKFVAGAFTSLTTPTTNIVANDIVKADVVSTTITGYVNGVSKTTITDAAIPSGSFGVAAFVDTGGVAADARLDDWEGGDLLAAVVVPPKVDYSNFPKPTMRQPLTAGTGRTN